MAKKADSHKISVRGRSVEERQRVQLTGTCAIRTAAIVQVLADEVGESVGYVLDEVFKNVETPDAPKIKLAIEKIVARLDQEKPEESPKKNAPLGAGATA